MRSDRARSLAQTWAYAAPEMKERLFASLLDELDERDAAESTAGPGNFHVAGHPVDLTEETLGGRGIYDAETNERVGTLVSDHPGV